MFGGRCRVVGSWRGCRWGRWAGRRLLLGRRSAPGGFLLEQRGDVRGLDQRDVQGCEGEPFVLGHGQAEAETEAEAEAAGVSVPHSWIRVGLLALAVGALAAPAALGVSGSDTITTSAGTGTAGFVGEGGQATSAQLSYPWGVAIAGENVYVVDNITSRIRKVSGGIITTIAGTGTPGYSGDGGQATSAQLNYPEGVAVDGQGNLYIADAYNQRVRKITPAGIITTIAGTGTAGYSGDGGQATSAQLNYPGGVAVDTEGDLFIADESNSRIRKVTPGGVITTAAGNGTPGYSGDGGQATSAQLNFPYGVAVDPQGNLYVADTSNYRIRKVTSDGTITTFAGTGTFGFSGDGGPATSAQMTRAFGVALDTAGNVYFGDQSNFRIRKVDRGGTIATVAGTGAQGFSVR